MTLPACSQVWKVGSRLPAGYRGCSKGGTNVKDRVIECETGQRIFVHEEKFFAAGRGPIFRAHGALLHDARYRHLQRACGA